MSPALFVGEWALRSAAVAIATAGLLAALRVRSSSVRLAAWTAALFASLLIPVLTPILPAVRVPMAVASRLPPKPAISPILPVTHAALPMKAVPGAGHPGIWQPLLLSVYALGSGLLLVRIATGVALTRRILRRSTATGRTANGVPILESRDLEVPAALGVRRVSVVLPRGWREWDPAKLHAVLAHETAHVSRRDPAVQLLSATHRAVLWFSPTTWWMHRNIVRLGEEASDDAALAASGDRASYAEVLLQFLQRGGKLSHWEGVAMARYGNPQKRIDRILDGRGSARPVTRYGLTAIVTIAAPIAFLAAAVAPKPPVPPSPAPPPPAPSAPAQPSADRIPPTPPAEVPQPPPLRSPADTMPGRSEHRTASPQPIPGSPPPGPPPAAPESAPPLPSTPSPGTDAVPPAAFATPFTPGVPGSEESSSAARIDRYLVVDGDSMSGSWDTRDETRMEGWRSTYGSHFAWFRRGGRDYIVTDAKTLADLREAMAPQREVNAKQSEVNRAQGEVNRHQADVNAQQSKVSRAQAEVSARQQEVSQYDQEGRDASEAQSKVNELQSRVNEAQSRVNEMQAEVNTEQHAVNGQQEIVSRIQERVSREIQRALGRIFEDAFRSGLAREAE